VNRFCLLIIGGLLLPGCGANVDTVVAESVLVDIVLTVEPGSFVSYPFSVDFVNMNEPLIFAGFLSDGGSTLARVLVLTEANFALWRDGEAYVAALRSGRIPTTSVRFFLQTNGDYRVVFSNREDTVNARSMGVFATLLWQPPS
jgi:hypothetical protein